MEEKGKIKFSASDLVKKSASQILFTRGKSQIVSDQMLKGEQFQKDTFISKGGVAEELRGKYLQDNFIIYFCNDMLKDKAMWEIKSVNDPINYPQWYLNSSLLQVAFYKSLLMNSDGVLSTPQFRIDQGYEKQEVIVNKNIDYYLLFDKQEFKVDVLNDKEIILYFMEKAQSTLNWDDAKSFDSITRFKEFDILRDSFNFTKIK